MALLWLDGLDKYGTAADLAIRGYTPKLATTFEPTGGRGGGGAIKTANEQTLFSANDFTLDLPSGVPAGSSIHVAMWMKLNLSTFNSAFLTLGNKTTGHAASFRVHTNFGEDDLEVNSFRGSAGFADETTPANGGLGSVPAYMTTKSNLFVHVELVFKGDAAGGTGGLCKVWLDGKMLINFAGNTTSSFLMETIDQIGLSGNTAFFDDIVVWDETGSDFAPAQLGLHKIETLNPNADGSFSDFDQSGAGDSPPAAHFESVNDVGFHDGDTTYVSNAGGSAGDKESFGIENMTSNPNTVYLIALNTRARYEDSVFDLRPFIKSGATSVNGANQTLAATYKHYQDLFYEDPNTSAEFLASEINNLEIGVEQNS